MKYLCCLLWLLCQITVGSIAQDTKKLYRIHSKLTYLQDIDTLAKNLTQVHPSPYEFMGKKTFWQVVEKKKKLIHDNTTFSEFIWICSEIVANINCSHTSLGWFNQERSILPVELMFPMEGKFIDNRLYVYDPLVNRNKIAAGTEIFSINGIDVNSIRREVYKHINSQGYNESYKRLLLNGYFTSYLPYALNFPKSYTILVKGRIKPVKLIQLSKYASKPRVSPKNECQENLCLKIKKEDSLAIMTIRSFAYYGPKFPVYKKFIHETFEKIGSKKIKHLIIDVRMNDGGPSYAASLLLKYLFDKPFKYWSHTAFQDERIETYHPFKKRFSGNLFVLIDGDCSSTTPHFLSLIKQNKLGTLVGEEVNGNHLTFGGQKWFRLPNTGIKYCIGRNKYITSAVNFPKEQGILPDHHITQTIADHLGEKDTVMEYTLNLIKK